MSISALALTDSGGGRGERANVLVGNWEWTIESVSSCFLQSNLTEHLILWEVYWASVGAKLG